MVVPALALTLLLNQAGSFGAEMQLFEAAKQKQDWAAAETHITNALRQKRDEYAYGSLVWTLLKTDKSDIALKAAVEMRAVYGDTAYTLATLIDALIAEGRLSEATTFATRTQNASIRASMPWQRDAMIGSAKRVSELTRPTIFDLEWTLDRTHFNGEKPTKFKFPLLSSDGQKFTFELEGAKGHRVLTNTRNVSIVEITPGKGNVKVRGRVTFFPQVISARTRRELAKSPIPAEVQPNTGKFLYHREVFDPKNPSIASIATAVRRSSAIETIRAILSWRAKEMPYGKLPGGPEDTLTRVVKHHTGVCHEISHMATALARANNIPAYVIGVTVIPNEPTFSNVESAHGIIAVNFPQIGWTYLEPQDPNALSNYIATRHLRFAYQSAEEAQAEDSLQGLPFSGKRVQ